jgi:CDP-glycerol glycerophosphotransferase (TagB/SpsB family)
MVSSNKRSLLRKVFSLLSQWVRVASFWAMERLFPVRAHYWAFCTWPGSYAHTMDNPRAVFEEIKDDPSIVKVILRKRGQAPESTVTEGANVRVVEVESLRGAYYLAVSKFILTGYGLSGLCSYAGLISRRHKIIQLWHGIPLKRIGKLFPGELHWENETPKYTATVCSSVSDQKIMAAAFAPVPMENVWLSGLPRNDLILKDESRLPADYRGQLERIRARLSGRKLVLYAPTWRASEIGIYPFTDQERAALNALLNKHNVALGIRAHANRRVEDAYADILKGGSVFFVNDYPDVNVLLRVTDVLITDYSSIYIDFMVTGRPILNFTYDIDEYVKERGFLYDLKDALPGAWFTSVADLLLKLEAALEGQGVDAGRYLRAKNLFHSHSGNSAAQVTANIKALM